MVSLSNHAASAASAIERRVTSGRSEPERIVDLRCRAAVERAEMIRLELSPGERVDEVHVIAGAQNPAEARLPAENAAHGVVLQVVPDRHPRAEVCVDDAAENLG